MTALARSDAPVRLGVVLARGQSTTATLEIAQRAEKVGLAEVWLSEPGDVRDGVTIANVVASSTSTVGLGLDFADPFARHPGAIAMEAVKLHEASRGRVLLRLGEVSPRVADEASLNTMVQGIVTVRSMLRNEPTIPVYVGAVSSRALYLAGAHADGVQLGALANPGYVDWAWQEIARGARDHGRDPASIDLVASVLVRVDRNAERARDRALNLLAFWLHRVEWSVIEHSGADLERVAAIRRSVERYGIGPALPLITDDIVNTFAAVGDPELVTATLERYVEAGIRGVLAWPIPSGGNGWELLTEQVWPRVLRAAAPRVS